ncbi:MAG: hypothetical protein ACW99R_15140 [Candidatus Hodarchaeales archaeon]|jgi:hypothetical protein
MYDFIEKNYKNCSTAEEVQRISKPYKRIVAMAVNSRGPGGEKYYEAGVCMVAHINQFSRDDVDKILVFDLGLEKHHRENISSMENVLMLDFPSEVKNFYGDFLRPKHFAWKYAVTWYAGFFADTVLYMDAGKFPTCSLKRMFEVIEEDEFLLASPHQSFCSGDNFRKEWLNLPIGQGHPAVPVTEDFCNAMKVNSQEARYPQCFAAIVGYRCGSKYHSNIIEKAFYSVQNPMVCSNFPHNRQHTNDQALITLLAIRANYRLLHMEVFRTFFGPGFPDQKRLITRNGEDILVFWRAHGDEVQHLMSKFKNEKV